MKRIEDIISIIREEMATSAPTMNLGAGKIAGTVESGDDPPVKNRKKRKFIYGKGYRVLWNKKT